jgi:replication factor A3
METPIVNSTTLQHHINKMVLLPGTCTTMDSQSAIINSTDQGQVQIHLMPGSKLSQGNVLVLGKVGEDLSIQEVDTTVMNGSFGIFC